jgi:DNA polymerase elongation subunit (family B)
MTEIEKLKQRQKELKLKINQLDAKQMCIKVFINSIYG